MVGEDPLTFGGDLLKFGEARLRLGESMPGLWLEGVPLGFLRGVGVNSSPAAASAAACVPGVLRSNDRRSA